ncbi:MBL fold metallo-hydrolase [Acinetobacter sp. MD2(2019)]|uniref:MBL fold metallo-hydrolase n=1 Tax=Acinetobacter sp. MD2(2019) TaxID=2605273 RepID=UPI002D1EA299|nr:MBL fold metallo-hydrolase [Acinetobacter sp. MD2(2019)]MEB3753114.1 FprA family A-type flavoprotein [Acinetobacter sp. MD2(2019)]
MFERTTSQVLYDNGTHKCIRFSSLVVGEGIQANQFLIIDHERAAILDPGGDLTYVPLTMELNKYTKLKNLDYVMASHQDPDIITSMPRWLVYTDAKIVASKLWARFLPHLSSSFMSERMKGNWEDRLIELSDQGQRLRLGLNDVLAIPAHFLHSVGSFQFYDPVAKILFSGDMGASIVEHADAAIVDFNAHIPKMKGFHQRYMCSNKIIRLWVNMVRELDIEMIVPQHGAAFIGKTQVNQFLDWIEQLACGIDLMNENIFSIPR